MAVKYIFVTGGVVSSLGKGITAASIGLLLQKRGLQVTILKFDPYLNVDPGTMNPFQHGEVFVTEDGAETDLDLGHYERFLHRNLTRDSNVTAGQVYYALIQKEREGKFLGKTVQVVPHLTDEIKERVRKLGRVQHVDVVIAEIGGTVGDIESLPFLEAIRQMRLEEGFENTLFVHVTLVPYIPSAGELKTKPTQHSVQKLREIGIQPDFIVCRTDRPLTREVRNKIALFATLPRDAVFEALDVETIYEVPLVLHRQALDSHIVQRLQLDTPEPDLSDWEQLVEGIKNPPKGEVEIALCGKYVHLKDAYKSVLEAFVHAGVANGVRVQVRLVDTEEIEKHGAETLLEGVDGILVPGGFGKRGVEGKIQAVRYARENGVPFLGICLGMQVATVEFARHVLGLRDAHSTEFNPHTPHPVITLLPEQERVKELGGTLRLGASPIRIRRNTLAWRVYQDDLVLERHRHRYEFNPEYRDRFERAGFLISGEEATRGLVEIIELRDHPFFIAGQFHPEFKSRPMAPHPLFRALVAAALERRKSRHETGKV